MGTYLKALRTSGPVSMAGGAFSGTSQRIRPLILGSIMSKSCQLNLGVRSISHDTGTDNAVASFTDPMGTYMKVLRTSDPVFMAVALLSESDH